MAVQRTASEKRQQIMDLVRNHLSRAADPSVPEPERLTAEEQAARLIRRHDLDVVKLAESDASMQDMFLERSWFLVGGYMSARNTLVMAATKRTKTKVLRRTFGHEKKNQIMVFGTPAACEFAEMLYTTLELQMYRELRQAQKSGRVSGKTGAYSFCVGFAQRVYTRMLLAVQNEQKEEARTGDTSTALVLATSLDEAFNNKYGRLRKSTVQRRVLDRDAFNNGASAGERADISGGRNHLGNTSKALM